MVPGNDNSKNEAANADFVQIVREVPAHFPGIIVLYIFGSQATGEATEQSDLDVAVLLEEEVLRDDPLIDLRIADFLQTRAGKPVEAIVMNRANPILQHEVLRTGFRVFEADPEHRANFELLSFKSYLDHCHFQMKRAKAKVYG